MYHLPCVLREHAVLYSYKLGHTLIAGQNSVLELNMVYTIVFVMASGSVHKLLRCC